MATERVFIEISKALTEAIGNLEKDYQGSSLTDIFLVVDRESAELSVYDDEENLLAQRIIDAWIDISDKKRIVSQLRKSVEALNKEKKFDGLDLYKPFSISITDEDFIVQEELLVIEDDSVIKLDNNFLERIDKEFDEFLDKLLKE